MAKHHFIPQFYLAGFKSSDIKGDRLWVLDQKQPKQWRARLCEIGHEKGLYRLDTTDGDSEALEKGFGQFEHAAAAVVRRIAEAKCLPAGADLDMLVNFVAFARCRLPQSIKAWSDAFGEISKRILKISAASRDRLQSQLQKARANGGVISDGVDCEGLREFITRDEYTVQVGQNRKMRTMLESMDVAIQVLGTRNWSLLVSMDSDSKFVCSDNPVVLTSNVPLPPLHSPGLGMCDTELTMPLNSEMALLSTFEEPPQTIQADRRLVACVNTRTCLYSRFVYSAEREFPCLLNGSLCGISDVFSALRRRKDMK